MTTAATFSKQSPSAVRFDKRLGRAVGWACFSKKAGKDYVDLHGDHIPDDELFKAVDALMKLPVEERQINVDHAGPGRGSIVTAYALTEDVAKSLGADTGGDFGVVITFEPDAALMKSIEAGTVCLSIEGRSHDVETIAKSADGAGMTPHKRTLRKLELTKIAVVEAGAHEGASITLLKSAPSTETLAKLRATSIAKATPALTTAEEGHTHTIYDCCAPEGRTSWECMTGDNGCGHSHPFILGPDGALVIGMTAGHTHALAVMPDMPAMPKMPPPTENTAMADADMQKKLDTVTADLAKSQARLSALLGLPDDQRAFAKRLDGAALAAFLDAPAADRAAKATPIHKSERTGRVYFAGDEALVDVVKDADAQAVELAKTREERDAVAIEKRAEAALGHVGGKLPAKVAVLKAVEGIADEATRTEALALLKAIDTAHATLFKAPGVSVVGDSPIAKSAQGELDAIAVDLQKKNPAWSFAKAQAEAMATERGRQLYDAIESARRRPSA